MSAKKGGSASAKSQRQAHTYEVRDIVLGKVRGYAPWPGMVVDPDTVPSSVAAERPGNKKTTFYCVRFFPTGDYAWLVEKDISKLQPKEITDYLNSAPGGRRSNDIMDGYKIAQDPKEWIEEKAAQAAAAASASDDDEGEVDQLNSGDETTSTTKTKKRKRESESASAKKSVKVGKAKKETGGASAKKSASARGKKGSKSKEMVESEDDAGDEDAGTRKKTSPPPAKRAKRDKDEDGADGKGVESEEAIRVRDWRHKLQKSFLSNKTLPKDEDMPGLDELFKMIEDFEGMTIEHLQFSKIGKVMRHIAALPEEKVPRDSEFKFRERSDVLVKKWHQILNATKGANGVDAGLGPAPATNGTSTEDNAEHEGEKAVTEGTAALDINGKEDDAVAEGDAADAPGEADTSALDGDVTMSEAA